MREEIVIRIFSNRGKKKRTLLERKIKQTNFFAHFFLFPVVGKVNCKLMEWRVSKDRQKVLGAAMFILYRKKLIKKKMFSESGD